MDESHFSEKIPSSANVDSFLQISIFLILQKKHSIQFEKRHYYEIMSFYTHFTANLPPLPIFKKIQSIFLKTHICFFQKTQIAYQFEKSYDFTGILLTANCYNLVMKIFETQNRRTFSMRT